MALELDIHPTLKPLKRLSPDQANNFVERHFSNYPYSKLLADMVLAFGNPDTLMGVKWEKRQQVIGFEGGLTELEGEVGLLVGVSEDEVATPHFMQLRLFRPEDAWVTTNPWNLKWQRRGRLSIHEGQLDELLAGGQYVGPFNREVAVFENTDQESKDGIKGGRAYRREVVLAEVTRTRSLSQVDAVFTNPWLAEAVLYFDRQRRILDKQFNTLPKAEERRPERTTINLQGTAIIF